MEIEEDKIDNNEIKSNKVEEIKEIKKSKK